MNIGKYFCSAALAAAFLITPNVGAALVSGTLLQSGDLTIDTNQNLEFLAINYTKAISYNQTLTSTYVTQYGFRIATLAEFDQLVTDAGATNLTGTFNTADLAGVQSLISLLGSTISVPTTLNGITVAQGLYGFVNAPGVPAGSVQVAGADYQSAALGEAAQDQARVAPNFNQFVSSAAPPISGTFLVKAVTATATPEPSSVGIASIGFLFLGALALRRARAA